MATTSAAGLPGFHSPAVGFEQPFEMLLACHERVQRSLALLRRIVAHVETEGHDASSRGAAGDVLRYFDIAGPHHHEDEERHLFPALDAHPDSAVRAAVVRLRAEHLRMHTLWAALRQLLLRWRDDAAPPAIGPADHALIDEYVALYEGHIPLEESVAYPAAQALLSPEVVAQAGAEMADRRRQ